MPTMAVLILLSALTGCDNYDSEYIPYMLKGLDVYVWDNEADTQYFGGRVKANYFTADDARRECYHKASAVAAMNNLTDWSFVCCTVTASSDCVTKVK